MGFSVSGSLAIVAVGALIATSMVYTAGANGFERVNDAREDHEEGLVEQRNAGLEIASTTYNASNDTLVVAANNTGTTELSLDATDVLVDNAYITNGTTTVAGDSATDLWLPGERLTVEVPMSVQPDAVTIAIEPGLSDREVI